MVGDCIKTQSFPLTQQIKEKEQVSYWKETLCTLFHFLVQKMFEIFMGCVKILAHKIKYTHVYTIVE